MRVKFQYAIFEKEDNGYCVFNYKIDSGKTITCTGYYLPKDKLYYDFTAKEAKHPNYGIQYHVTAFQKSVVTTKDEIIEYISISYKGIGKKMAEKVYNCFGEDSINVIENDTEALRAIKGFSAKKIEIIKQSCQQKYANKDLYMFLLPYHFTSKQIEKIVNIYKENVLEQIKENPYILCDIKGIDFKKADELRNACEIDTYDSRRMLAASTQALKDGMLRGHVGLTKKDLTFRIYELLQPQKSYSICESYIWKEIHGLIEREILGYRKVFYNNNIIFYLYLNFMRDAEIQLAKDIIRFLYVKPKNVDDIDGLIDKYSTIHELNLDESQWDALKKIMENQIIILTGGPGTGKTTIIKLAAAMYEEVYNSTETVFLAPTGRAARRLSESVNKEAQTAHSRFSLRIKEQLDGTYEEKVEPITTGLVTIDEFSMVDMLLAHKIFSNILGDSRIILSGDEDQLASVGPGNVLGDMIASGVIPVVRLKYSHRQGKGSLIDKNAKFIRDGKTELLENEDFQIIDYEQEKELKGLVADGIPLLENLENKIIEDFFNLYHDPSINSVVCLCPYKKFPCGVYSVNQKIQNIINPQEGRLQMPGINGMVFRENDLIMHLKNDEDVMNGDVGVVKKIEKNDILGYRLTAEYITYDGVKEVIYTPDDADEIMLAYAITIHKSQGSEYDAVITCFTEFHKKMHYRNVFYTDITRAKKLVKIYSSKSLLTKIIKNKDKTIRNTLLAHNLRIEYEANLKQMRLAL